MRKFAPVLIIIAVIIIAIFVVFACMNIMNNTPKGPDTTVAPSVAPGEETPVPKVTETPEATDKKPDDGKQTPTPTPEVTAGKPTATPTPVSTATPATQAPTATVKPTATPEVATGTSGSFKSDTGTSINVRTDWSYEDQGSMRSVKIRIYLECGTISVSQRNDNTLTVNGKTIIYNTEPLKYTEKVRHETLIYEYTFLANKGETIDVEATWHFRGTYSGVRIETIVCSGSFKVQ